MKKHFLLICFCFLAILSRANHITGGEMFYVLVSESGGTYTYAVTLKLYRDCNSTGAPLDAAAPIAIFNNANNQMVWSSSITRTNIVTLNLTTPNPCIQNPPVVCYQVGYYEFTVNLPASTAGYTIAYQRCCRITGINNLLGSSSVGSTYTAQIPGTVPLTTAPANNSARFIGADTVAICANTNFCYDFSAVDPDKATLGDSLSYSFCNAFTGGTTGNPAPNPPDFPPYNSVPYNQPAFSGGSPLGPGVTLNPVTGFMCGVAPAPGIYVVTVCVTEWRNGVAIAVQRKDLQIKVGDCNIADADLKPVYISCDGFTYTFANEAPFSPLVTSWYWEFGDGNTSTQQNPTYTYADTGTYNIKLVVNRGQQCSDSALAKIKVYPGFFPGFIFNGVCATKPTQFTDTTKTKYGVVDTWSWDFGETTATNDTSHLQNPVYTYPFVGVKTVRFIVTNSKGCIDTVYKDITIMDKPPLTLTSRDTLMCIGDSVKLQANGSGIFTWTPNTNIIDANTATPTVFPPSTQYYYVQLDQNSCIARDSVRVRVVSAVTLNVRPDTIICLTDSVRLMATGDGLRYVWSPAATLSNPNVPNPMALPGPGVNTYTVTASIGKCIATASTKVTTVPYPRANAGRDTVVCFRTPAQLNASITGSSFTWTPNNTLSPPNSLNPIANPPSTTSYILTVFDNVGCPKPNRDTITVTVLPKIMAYAGNDTSVVAGQPLQLLATGGTSYLWIPSTGLSNPAIANPIGIYNGSFDSIRYKVEVRNASGCVDSAFVKVKIYRVIPQVFVPTAFTPNRDGKNDLIRPIAVGIKRIEYFRIFNRWGQLVFETTTNEYGWDGKIGGVLQGTNTFVWVVKAIDYTDQPYFAKGTVTLIR